jgi:hypothetical protein
MAVLAAGREFTALTLQTVAAMFFVAAVVAVLALVVYGLVVGALAWVLLMLQGIGWLIVHAVRGAWSALRSRPARRARLTAEPAPDLRVRPSG